MLGRPVIAAILGTALALQAAAGQWDGIYTGTAGDWEVKLVVDGAKGEVTLVCPQWDPRGFEPAVVAVSSDGRVSGFWGGNALNRKRMVGGDLPQFAVADVSTRCRGGSGILTKR